jgi:hypothetical protein
MKLIEKNEKPVDDRRERLKAKILETRTYIVKVRQGKTQEQVMRELEARRKL